MAAYESAENEAAFVDLQEFIDGREFAARELPDPRQLAAVFQRGG